LDIVIVLIISICISIIINVCFGFEIIAYLNISIWINVLEIFYSAIKNICRWSCRSI